MKISKEKFGRYIRKVREEKKISRKELAVKLHVSEDAIAKWETGKRYPDFEMVNDLADELGISVQSIYDNSKRDNSILLTAICSVLAIGLLAGVIAIAVINGGRTRGKEEVGQSSAIEESETSTEVDETKEEETVTLNIYYPAAANEGIQTGWMADILEEKFGVKLNVIAELYGTNLAQIEKGDKEVDILAFVEDSIYNRLREAGQLLDLEESDLLHEYGEYIETNLKDSLDANKQRDGGILTGISFDNYVKGSINQEQTNTWEVRWDLYEKIGKPQVKDFDDYAKMLEKLIEANDADNNGYESYGLSLWSNWDNYMMQPAESLASAYFGCNPLGFGLIDLENDKYYDLLDKEGPYYKVLAMLNELYRRGLIDPDSKNQGYEDVIKKLDNGQIVASIINYTGSYMFNNDSNIANNEIMLPLIPETAKPVLYEPVKKGFIGEYAISSSTKYPELCMQLLNYLASPEGQLTCMYGPRGVIWDWDENGKLFLTDDGKSMYYYGTTDMLNYEYNEKPLIEGVFPVNSNMWDSDSFIPGDSFSQTFNVKSWESLNENSKCEAEKNWKEYTGHLNINEYLLEKGVILESDNHDKITQTDSDDEVLAAVKKYISYMSWECVYAESEAEFEKAFEDMCEGAEEEGYYNYDLEYFTKEGKIN